MAIKVIYLAIITFICLLVVCFIAKVANFWQYCDFCDNLAYILCLRWLLPCARLAALSLLLLHSMSVNLCLLRVHGASGSAHMRAVSGGEHPGRRQRPAICEIELIFHFKPPAH